MSLAGKRILVVEDEFLIALETQQALESIGAEVIGPAYSVDEALTLVAADLDAAVLDVNLGGRSSAPVANALLQRNVPLVFASGYGNKSGVFGNAPVLDKPFNRDQLAAAVESIMDGSAPQLAEKGTSS